ncbi:hypothetical protein GCM10007876_08380 [Litoribrevibacter albus]|uniref:Uncharacterized protein n=1 Tax=Litoribrevibacter albus TaxID=1473156 RepID=A0AA37S758_9GAMM|nr:hypothetical protein GCM10007876_08380 [Litoribrevibacter albus]
MAVKPPGKSNWMCKKCHHILTTKEAALHYAPWKKEPRCPKCNGELTYIAY